MATTEKSKTRSTKATSPKATKPSNGKPSSKTKNGKTKNGKPSSKTKNGEIKIGGILFDDKTIRATAAQFSIATNIDPPIEYETMKPRAIVAELAENIESLTTAEEARKIKPAYRALLGAIYADAKYATENLSDAVCKILAGKVAKEKKVARPPRRTVNRTSFTIAALAALPKGKSVDHMTIINSANDTYTKEHHNNGGFIPTAPMRQARSRCLECVQIMAHLGYVTIDGKIGSKSCSVTRIKDIN